MDGNVTATQRGGCLPSLRHRRTIVACPVVVTIVETSIFARRADKLLTAWERDELMAFLAANPTEGDLIEGTGGVRRVRFAARGKGKSGGVRGGP